MATSVQADVDEGVCIRRDASVTALESHVVSSHVQPPGIGARALIHADPLGV
jgi:hypothetical protein